MYKILPFLLFICLLFSFEKGKAQCVKVLTDEPIEVCSSGGTTINVAIEGSFVKVKWSPEIGINDPNTLNPIFENPIDTTYLLTLNGIDKETQDTCITTALIEIKTVQFDLILPKDTMELPCGDTIRLSAQVLPSESYFISDWETECTGKSNIKPFN